MIGLYLITHFGIGEEFIKTCQFVFGQLPLPTKALAVSQFEHPEQWVTQLKNDILSLNTQKEGVLIVTDLYGATPNNLIQQVTLECPHRVISGLNLPMLFKIYNYSTLALEDLALKAIDGGQTGIMTQTTLP